MSKRIDKSWIVYASIENFEHDRCVDVFYRPDQTYGFEEFRRDAEDAGGWTPVAYYSSIAFPSAAETLSSAEARVRWLADILDANVALRSRVLSFSPPPAVPPR